MISEENATIIKDCADNLRIDMKNRDIAIKEALKLGATVAEIVNLTGLTRARIYQIKDGH